jgi:Tol biopolymer transport system component
MGRGRRAERLMGVVGVAWLAGWIVLATVSPAGAAYTGANGDIAFVSTRNNNEAIYQVNPNYIGAPGAGLGTVAGDAAATTGLTAGAIDAEPFYSPDGAQVFFSSDRSKGHWAIYDIAQSPALPPSDTTDDAVELSQTRRHPTNDDYAPSVGPDGETVVFNRNDKALYTLYASKGPSSVCLLYKPPAGLAPASDGDGSGSRAEFDPVDPSKLIYVSADGHIHLLSGIPTPAGKNPCKVSARSLTDTDLSAEATYPNGHGIAHAVDADPDWSPDGTEVVFDSTRGGGHTLWILTLGAHPSASPLWPGLAAPRKQSDTQPVFSPDGRFVVYTQPVEGSQVVDYEIDGVGSPVSRQTDLSRSPGTPINSQPDWQSALPAQTPEAPLALLLPIAGVLTVGGVLALQRRRRGRRAPVE